MMQASEIVAWANLVDRGASPADIDAIGLGRTRRRNGAREEMTPADPRFRVIFLDWSGEPPKLQSLSVELATAESLPAAEVEAQFGKPSVEAYTPDLIAHPPSQSTFFQGPSGKELCLTIARKPDGRVESVMVHAVRPLPKPNPPSP
jgi:hypothetical protein